MGDGDLRRVVLLAFFWAPLLDCLLLLCACVALVCCIRVSLSTLFTKPKVVRCWLYTPRDQREEMSAVLLIARRNLASWALCHVVVFAVPRCATAWALSQWSRSYRPYLNPSSAVNNKCMRSLVWSDGRECRSYVYTLLAIASCLAVCPAATMVAVVVCLGSLITTLRT